MSRRRHVTDTLSPVVSVPFVVAVTALVGAVSAGAPLAVALVGSTGSLVLAALAVVGRW